MKWLCFVSACCLLWSCTLGMSVGKQNMVEQRVSTAVDSVTTIFSLYPLK